MLLLAGMPSFLQAAEWFTARVAAVFDGDTVLLVRRGHAPEKLRLLNIDAPEKKQPYGEEARRTLAALVLQRQVQVESVSVDQYGRLLGHLYLAGHDINAEMVRRGMAWEYTGFSHDARYTALQLEAQQARRGLWRQTAPEAPWQWRRLHREAASPHATPPTLFYDARCGRKQHCSQMRSCDEAYFYLLRCGEQGLDRNGDGIPCDSLCNE